MRRFVNARTGIALVTLLGSVALAASCTVDTEGLVFQDDPGGDGGTNSSGGNDGTGNEAGMGGGGFLEGPCEHGNLSCNGKQVEICAGGEWFPVGEPCPFLCAAGLCVGSCEPGTTQCASSLTQQTCTSTGSWGEAEECEFACVDGACGGECKPGAMRCSADGTPQRCDDRGQWQDQRETPCDGGSSGCKDGRCTTCSGDETQCFSPTHVQICDGDNWKDPEECEYVCVDGDCGGECKPGTTRCANNTSKTHFQTCGTDGQWGPSSDCGEQACVDGACVGVCRPGRTKCEGSIIHKCTAAGQWEPAKNCSEDGLTCVMVEGGKATCGECQEGSRRCEYDFVIECTPDLKWKKTQHCDPNRSLVCYQAQCYGTKKVCAEGPPLPKGCQSDNSYWRCDQEGAKATEGKCHEDTPICVNGDCVAALPE